jgi:hypothetical protein
MCWIAAREKSWRQQDDGMMVVCVTHLITKLLLLLLFRTTVLALPCTLLSPTGSWTWWVCGD